MKPVSPEKTLVRKLISRIFFLYFQAFAFGFTYHLAHRKVAVANFRKEHPVIVTMIILIVGHYLIYKLSSLIIFALGILLPLVFIIIHASCRMRSMANKLTNVGNMIGFNKVTPMGYILEYVGIEPDIKYK